MSTWHQQALIDAPVQGVWSYVGDPARFPEWAYHVISVTGLAEVEEGAEFRQTTRTPIGKVRGSRATA